jgi:hypothetical protein
LALRDFYKRLLNFTITSDALMGAYQDIHQFNREHTEWYNEKVLSFVRWSDTEKLIVISNFNSENTYGFELGLPQDIIKKWNLKDGEYSLKDQLYNKYSAKLIVKNNKATVRIDIKPLESFILQLQ